MNLFSRSGGRIRDPWREFGQMQNELNRLLAGARTHTAYGQREFPSVNLFVNEHDLLVTLELAGIDPTKIDVTVTGDTVTIRGDRPAEPGQSGEKFQRRERPTGAFTRALELPFSVDPSKTEAKYERGVLTVRLGRPESQKPKKVTIKTA